jgi:hypothetical protein
VPNWEETGIDGSKGTIPDWRNPAAQFLLIFALRWASMKPSHDVHLDSAEDPGSGGKPQLL